ncbi:hypothetical protein SAMN06265348_101546 [Pedobacter westerhofensis]|uniref:DUF962 domain-containing protein n=1 Tax=Pedobacter westerhofensis TaxID=425512 RepID=A0A521AZH3_9SPHI|nr:DUF962 domain-containing protein [Pedobacter westerhofensis]SMO39920.1 hypothetical protein SAMN06265348_101546 [Pedobacter westerhofensis]
MTGNNHQVQPKKYSSLKEFYPFYLSEHRNTMNRALHFTGISLLCLCFITSMLFHNVYFFIAIPFVAFGFSWIGHLFFEKNRPSTWKYPFFNLACDFLLFGDIIMGRQSFKST